MLCFAFAEQHPVLGSRVLNDKKTDASKLLQIATLQVGIREASGKNDGKNVEQYLQSVGLKKGDPWCAAFVSWVFQQAGYKKPRTGWCPALFNAKVNQSKAEPGAVFGIWFPDLHRIAHVGLVEKVEGKWLISIEGNTNLPGAREGDGVYRKRRPLRLIYRLANWLPGKENE
jgi:hypothetical protein